MGNTDSTLSPGRHSKQGTLVWSAAEIDGLLETLDVAEIATKSKDGEYGLTPSAKEGTPDTIIPPIIISNPSSPTGGFPVWSPRRRRAIARRSDVPMQSRRHSDPKLNTMTTPEIDSMVYDLKSDAAAKAEAGTETEINIIPSDWYQVLSPRSLAALEVTDGPTSISPKSPIPMSEDMKDLIDAGGASVEPIKEVLMRNFGPSMLLNCIGVLLGDTAVSTLPTLEKLTPRAVSLSVASMTESTAIEDDTVYDFDESSGIGGESASLSDAATSIGETAIAVERAKRDGWKGVFVVGNYKYENEGEEEVRPVLSATVSGPTVPSSLPTLKLSRTATVGSYTTRPIGLGGASPDMDTGVMDLSSISTAVVLDHQSSVDSLSMSSPSVATGKSRLSKRKSRKEYKKKMKDAMKSKCKVSALVPREVVQSPLMGGLSSVTKKEHKAMKKVMKESLVINQVLRTFCYDSMDSEVIFFGETMSYHIDPCLYRDRGKFGTEGGKAPSEIAIDKLEDEIHPQIIFECFDHQQLALSSKQESSSIGRRPKFCDRSSLSSGANYVSTKPGSLLIYVMQDLKVAKEARAADAIALAATPPLLSVPSSVSSLTPITLSSPRSVGDDDEDETMGEFLDGTQRTASLRQRSHVQRAKKGHRKLQKKKGGGASSKGERGMDTKIICVGLIRISDLLDKVEVSEDSARSSTVLVQIPLYHSLSREFIRTASMVMAKQKIISYRDLLSSKAFGKKGVASKFDIRRPAAIGNLVCSVTFNWGS